MEKEKIKVLCLFDSPTVNTGFGVLSRNLLKELYKLGDYSFDIIGINYHGDWYDRDEFPYRIIPAAKMNEHDLFGRDKLIYSILGAMPPFQGRYDIVFTIQDHFILEETRLPTVVSGIKKIMEDTGIAMDFRGHRFHFAEKTKPFKWIAYWPIDSVLKPNWVKGVMDQPDVSVFYTNYARTMANYHMGNNPLPDHVIYHGVNTKDFYPLKRSKQFREEYFKGKVKETDFLITNVNRNQPRKDIARTLKIFAELLKRGVPAKLYLHMASQDAGGNIHEMANFYGLKKDEDYITLDSFNTNTGVDVKTLNQIYNASDCIISTTLGEGWGFSLTEALATKTPLVAPYNTSIPEIMGIDHPLTIEELETSDSHRGIPVKAGSTKSEFVTLGIEDRERPRPITNVEDAVNKLEWLYNNKDSAAVANMIERGYKWVKTIPWEAIAKEWHNLFQAALKD